MPKGNVDYAIDNKKITRTDNRGRAEVVATLEDNVIAFESKSMDTKYRGEVVSFLGDEGIKLIAFYIKGQERDKTDKLPEKPKESPRLGDLTAKVVEYYMTYLPKEFQTRYRIHTNPDGSWKRAKVRRVEPLIDPETGLQRYETNQIEGGTPIQNLGKPMWNVIEKDDAIIGDRSNKYVFLPAEIVEEINSVEDDE